MDIEKIKTRKFVNYRNQHGEGRGKVVEVQQKANGAWVLLFDKDRGEHVKVRPLNIH